MTKVTAPAFSFGAQGSLGGSLTFTRRHGQRIAGRIPTHPDARTLPQVYRRWLFRDAAFYWTSLTPAQRAVWEAAPRPSPMSAWNYFLSTYLKAPIDLVLWLRLDTVSNTVAPDSSGHGNDGAISGPTRVAAVVDHGRLFSGAADDIPVPSDPSLTPSAAFTLMCWVKAGVPFTTLTLPMVFFWKFTPTLGYLWGVGNAPGNLVFVTADGGLAQALLGFAWSDLDWHHVAVTYDGALATSYVDGLFHASSAAVRPSVSDSLTPLSFALQGVRDYDSTLDDIRIYSRSLTAQQIYVIARTQTFPVITS